MKSLENSKGAIVPPRIYYILQLYQTSLLLVCIFYSSLFPLSVGISLQVLIFKKQGPEEYHLKDLVIH